MNVGHMGVEAKDLAYPELAKNVPMWSAEVVRLRRLLEERVIVHLADAPHSTSGTHRRVLREFLSEAGLRRVVNEKYRMAGHVKGSKSPYFRDEFIARALRGEFRVISRNNMTLWPLYVAVREAEERGMRFSETATVDQEVQELEKLVAAAVLRDEPWEKI